MNTLHRHPAGLLVPALAALALAGCGGGDGGISGTGSGTLRLALTDAPACGYDAVNVTVSAVRVHQSASAGENDGGWQTLALAAPRRIDLTDLTNGVLEELGETTLPAGRYTQLRLVLAENSTAQPFANSVVPTGGVETALTTPSAQQTGLKLNVDIDVAADQRADFVLDFDACKSVVPRGNSGHYNLKPVVAVIPRLSDAGMRVEGHVSPAAAAAGANVSVQFNGVPVKATPPDPLSGRFVLYPVPAGTYDLVVSATGRVTAVMTGVPVTTTAVTTVSSPAVPIAPPTAISAPRAVTGTVTPATATVRALQTLSNGPTVEVAWAAVDALDGSFGFALPTQPPVRIGYVANPATLNFTSDAAVGTRHTIEAALAGAVKTQVVDTAAVVPPLGFSFP